MCSTRLITAKIARFSLSCSFYNSRTLNKGCFRNPRVVNRSRNYYAAVPQASTPSHSVVFRVFFTLFLNFRTFFLKTPTFSPKRATGTVARYFSQLPQASRQHSLPPFWQGYVGLTEHSCSNQGNHSKTRKITVFFGKLLFSSLKSAPKSVVTLKENVAGLHQRFSTKNGAISKFSRAMTHLSGTSGPRGCTFATQFLHI